MRSAITATSADFRPTLSVLENFGETGYTAQRIFVGGSEGKLIVDAMLLWSRFAIALTGWTAQRISVGGIERTLADLAL